MQPVATTPLIYSRKTPLHKIPENWIQVAGKVLLPTAFFRTFAPAIEGNALDAWKRASLTTEAGDKWWQAPVINDDPEKDKKRGYPGSCKNEPFNTNDYD